MGTIISFYSYKGGVGRTMTLANIAVLLSKWGLRTLMIDWDLEAPNLDTFFRDYMDRELPRKKLGLLDLLISTSGEESFSKRRLGKSRFPYSSKFATLIESGLRDKDPTVRERTAETLGITGSDAVVDSLIESLSDHDIIVRERVTEALGKIGSQKAVDALIHTLYDNNVNIRLKAVEALGRTRCSRAIPALIKILEDSDASVRASSSLALGWIGSTQALEALKKAFEDENSIVRERARIAYEEIQSSTETSIRYNNWKDYLISIKIPDSGGQLHLITAGKRDSLYFQKLREFDIRSFYARSEGGYFIEALRNDWKKAYDFVLIDSRTGITDIGGICTVQMPDVLVMVFTPNYQSLEGIKYVTKMAANARQKMPVSRCNTLVLPILNKFDSSLPIEVSKKWTEVATDTVRELCSSWLPKSVQPIELLTLTKILYKPYFSFGEKLAVIEQGTSDPSGLGYAYETLAAILANKLEFIEELIHNRSSFLRLASSIDKHLDTASENSIAEFMFKLEKHKNWLEHNRTIGENLSAYDLRLPRVNLNNSDLRFAVLTKSDFRHTDLSNSDLRDSDFSETDLSGARLTHSRFERVNASKALLVGSNLENLTAGGANFESADLRNAIVRNSDLRQVNLSYAKLQDADLSSVYLSGSLLNEASMWGVELKDACLTGSIIRDADLRSAKFHNTILESVDLQGSDLSSSTGLSEKQIGKANLANTKLPKYMSSFSGVRIANDVLNRASLWFTFLLVTGLLHLLTNITIVFERISYLYFIEVILLLLISAFFQLAILKFLEKVTLLPAVFPDRIPIHKKLRPSLFNALCLKESKFLQEYYNSWEVVQRISVNLFTWLYVPIILTLGYLVIQKQQRDFFMITPVTVTGIVIALAMCAGLRIIFRKKSSEIWRGRKFLIQIFNVPIGSEVEDEILNMLRKFGPIVDLQIKRGYNTSSWKIQLLTEEQARKATAQLDGFSLKGKELYTNFRYT